MHNQQQFTFICTSRIGIDKEEVLVIMKKLIEDDNFRKSTKLKNTLRTLPKSITVNLTAMLFN